MIGFINEFEKKKLRRGVKKLSKRIKDDPGDFLSYVNRAEYYRLLKEYEKAELDFESALKISPEFPGLYFNRGVFYSSFGKPELALKDYTKAFLLFQKVYGRNIETEFTRLSKEDKNLLNSILNNRGSTYRQLEKLDLSLKDLKLAVKVNPFCSGSFNELAATYTFLKDYSRALENYSKSIQIDPKNSRAYTNRGNLYYTTRDFEKAIYDYEKALEIDPRNTTAQQNLEMIKILIGKVFGDKEISDKGLLETIDAAAKENRLVIKNEGDKSVLTIDDKKGGDEPRTSKIINRIRCAICKKNEGGMKKCSRCKNILYCSREYQVKDWKRHKKECKKIPRKQRQLL